MYSGAFQDREGALAFLGQLALDVLPVVGNARGVMDGLESFSEAIRNAGEGEWQAAVGDAALGLFDLATSVPGAGGLLRGGGRLLRAIGRSLNAADTLAELRRAAVNQARNTLADLGRVIDGAIPHPRLAGAGGAPLEGFDGPVFMTGTDGRRLGGGGGGGGGNFRGTRPPVNPNSIELGAEEREFLERFVFDGVTRQAPNPTLDELLQPGWRDRYSLEVQKKMKERLGNIIGDAANRFVFQRLRAVRASEHEVFREFRLRVPESVDIGEVRADVAILLSDDVSEIVARRRIEHLLDVTSFRAVILEVKSGANTLTDAQRTIRDQLVADGRAGDFIALHVPFRDIPNDVLEAAIQRSGLSPQNTRILIDELRKSGQLDDQPAWLGLLMIGSFLEAIDEAADGASQSQE